jgi:hypothetical protein
MPLLDHAVDLLLDLLEVGHDPAFHVLEISG